MTIAAAAAALAIYVIGAAWAFVMHREFAFTRRAYRAVSGQLDPCTVTDPSARNNAALCRRGRRAQIGQPLSQRESYGRRAIRPTLKSVT